MMNNTPKKENAAIELFSGFGNSDFRMKIGGTVYEVSTHFDPEGSRCVLQQFRDLIPVSYTHLTSGFLHLTSPVLSLSMFRGRSRRTMIRSPRGSRPLPSSAR